MPTLVIIRHAKSDWDVPVSDRLRPVAARGRRQAPETGRWISQHVPPLDLAVVSTATRAQQTWELVAAELDAVEVVDVDDAYTFDGYELLGVVRELPATAGVVALVSHNPAVEELVESLTGRSVPMPTSALAVIELSHWGSAGRVKGELVAAGRPADERWFAG